MRDSTHNGGGSLVLAQITEQKQTSYCPALAPTTIMLPVLCWLKHLAALPCWLTRSTFFSVRLCSLTASSYLKMFLFPFPHTSSLLLNTISSPPLPSISLLLLSSDHRTPHFRLIYSSLSCLYMVTISFLFSAFSSPYKADQSKYRIQQQRTIKQLAKNREVSLSLSLSLSLSPSLSLSLSLSLSSPLLSLSLSLSLLLQWTNWPDKELCPESLCFNDPSWSLKKSWFDF